MRAMKNNVFIFLGIYYNINIYIEVTLLIFHKYCCTFYKMEISFSQLSFFTL